MLARCSSCDRLVIRSSQSNSRLCVSCAKGVRAVASAAASESRIRAELYPRTDNVEVLPHTTSASIPRAA